LGNQALKWESSSQVNFGIDLGFFNERLTITSDIYRKQSLDLLMNAALSLSTGYERAFKNIGSIRNEGLELTVGFIPIKKSFEWQSEFNISFNRNKVLELVDNQSSLFSYQPWGADWENIPAYMAKLGAPVSQMYGFVSDGLYTYEDFDQINGKYVLKPTVAHNGFSTLEPGHKRYKDLNGDKIINDADKVLIGDPLPKHFGGWANNFRYKGFDLHLFFQWSFGNDNMNANRIIMESGGSYNVNQFATYLDRWTPENPDGKLPAVKGSLLKSYSSDVVEDGSFIRFKTVSFGYNIKPDFLKRFKISQARIYGSSQNLFTWTNYSGYDPEVSIRNSALMRGFDYSAYPRAKTYTFGLDLTF